MNQASSSSRLAPYTKSFRIPFHKGDPAGILYFAELFSIAHETFEEWIEDHIGLSWEDWFLKNPNLVPLRHVECDYFSPFFPGQRYLIQVKLIHIGNTSFEVEYSFFHFKRNNGDKVNRADKTNNGNNLNRGKKGKEDSKCKDEIKHAVLKMVHVFMDRKSKKKIPIPKKILQKLRPFL